MPISIEEKAVALSERFTALSNHAEKLVFPIYRKGIFEQRDLSNWNIVIKYIYSWSHPFATTEVSGTLFSLLWAIIYIVQYLALMLGLTLLYPILFNQTPFLPPTEIESKALFLLCLIAGVPSSIVSYAWWIDVLLNKKNPWWVKVGLALASFWMLNSIVKAMLAKSPSPILWEASDDTVTILFAFLVLLIPAISYFIAVLFDFLLSILLVTRTVFGSVRSIHESRPVETILKLSTEYIPSRQTGLASWKLIDLPKSEISVLRQWAESNRDGSEKRTVPAFLIATFIGVMLTSEFIRHAVDGFLIWLLTGTWQFFTQTSTQNLFGLNISIIFMTTVLLAFITFVAKSLMALFRNIVAQNLIIEACIVAEYVTEEAEIQQEKSPNTLELIIRFLETYLFKHR